MANPRESQTKTIHAIVKVPRTHFLSSSPIWLIKVSISYLWVLGIYFSRWSVALLKSNSKYSPTTKDIAIVPRPLNTTPTIFIIILGKLVVILVPKSSIDLKILASILATSTISLLLKLFKKLVIQFLRLLNIPGREAIRSFNCV